MVGPATRLIEYMAGFAKRYEARMRLGVVTDTADHTGEVVARHPLGAPEWTDLDEARVRSAAAQFVGEFEQLPPRYSAKKIDGVPAYRRMRRGEEVVLEPSLVSVYSLEIEEVRSSDVRFTVECSTGTYVRSLARDLGDALGVGAHLTELRRTRNGPFDVANALSEDALADPTQARAALLPAAQALAHLPIVDVGAEDAARLRLGQALTSSPLPSGVTSGEPLLVRHEGSLLAVGTALGEVLRPKKVFPDGL